MATESNDRRLVAADAADEPWRRQWDEVPQGWRIPAYRISEEPYSDLFTQNDYFLSRSGEDPVHDFAPAECPQRFADELAWWVWVSWTEGSRRLDPSSLRMVSEAIAKTYAFGTARGSRCSSIVDLDPAEVNRQAFAAFERRNQRLPSRTRRQHIERIVGQLHLYLSVRCRDLPWWAHNTWDLRADPRIPRREHEPVRDVFQLDRIEPAWLREGMRFHLRIALSTEMLRWSTAAERSNSTARHLGPFLSRREITGPPITTDPAHLRGVFADFSAELRGPEASAKGGRLSASAIEQIESQTQSFYTFMFDHAAEAVAATGDTRWGELTAAHTRLWGPAYRTRPGSRTRELTWYATSDLQRMLAYLDVLAAPRDTMVDITHPDGSHSYVHGLDDPQAARAWLLQAMTGRRASEILMLDYDPLEAIPGVERAASIEPPGEETFVAKLRYQQTKVDGVVPTILVEQAVVNVIREQQEWLADTYPGIESRYLFIGVKHQYRGREPRPQASYRLSLGKLDKLHGLTDAAGHPLRFTQTHRLRHTRATELLNDGVPLHVVQRYLGHRSPAMTARYAATLAATAEAEFLKHKKIGAEGRDITISPIDIYTMTKLASRTDRILPNGVCMLPPLKTCDKGNACLSCGHFATDLTHLDELRDQHRRTEALLAARQEQVLARTGRELTDDNVWARERIRELSSLQAVIERLDAEAAESAATTPVVIAGAGTRDRLPLLVVATRGSHEVVLDKAPPTVRDPQARGSKRS
ncbi:transposase [Tsukamurella pulmonis]|uniref:Phage integrase family protein n=1 Tax=Tsukamurella pulmonis TaxID=47312 RepID=A0A1H1A9E0_9ACTN|nr:tyrosine-type recombinase/integrase [Tsukamurella pulmonis]KXO95816.1 transposase [Tsukamurella pulmonis]SDQ36283.1 Phage integrase family protein [Tsukamurella pulmonis]SUQ39421.1 site-specific tyrosine recombinase XerC [Tsukamurella pulmonis]